MEIEWSSIAEVGLECQRPWSQQILTKEKTVETRSYALPAELIGRRIALIETAEGVARQSADAVAVRLGATAQPAQAQLDGFKSRALRAAAPAQRDLYASEWRALDVAEAFSAVMLVIVAISLVPTGIGVEGAVGVGIGAGLATPFHLVTSTFNQIRH